VHAVEGSYLPTRTTLYDDPDIRQSVPVAGFAKEALQHAKPRPISPYRSDMSLEMAEQFNSSLKGDVTPEQAAWTLQERLEKLIEEGQES
jgi:multiple sugar transport system substrate-binding protein